MSCSCLAPAQPHYLIPSSSGDRPSICLRTSRFLDFVRFLVFIFPFALLLILGLGLWVLGIGHWSPWVLMFDFHQPPLLRCCTANTRPLSSHPTKTRHQDQLLHYISESYFPTRIADRIAIATWKATATAPDAVTSQSNNSKHATPPIWTPQCPITAEASSTELSAQVAPPCPLSMTNARQICVGTFMITSWSRLQTTMTQRDQRLWQHWKGQHLRLHSHGHRPN